MAWGDSGYTCPPYLRCRFACRYIDMMLRSRELVAGAGLGGHREPDSVEDEYTTCTLEKIGESNLFTDIRRKGCESSPDSGGRQE